MLTFIFYGCLLLHRIDATRVTIAIPLRESFALPFIAVQICSTIAYLKHHDASQLNKVGKNDFMYMYHTMCTFIPDMILYIHYTYVHAYVRIIRSYNTFCPRFFVRSNWNFYRLSMSNTSLLRMYVYVCA